MEHYTVNIDESCTVGRSRENGLKLSSDLGSTSFTRKIKVSLLNRWIDKAIDNGKFFKID